MPTPIKRALVTGGAGFIGSHIVDRLMLQKVQVVVVDDFFTGRRANLQPHLDHPDFQLVHACIDSFPTLLQAMEGCDTVFHFQANADVRGGEHNSKVDFQQNIACTYGVLEAMQVSGVKSIVFASSAVVYGEPIVFPTPETYAPTQTSHYGASKLAGEAMIQAYANYHGWDWHIFRMASVLGPRYSHGCVIDFQHKLQASPKGIAILGNGLQKKAFLDVSDAVQGIFGALPHPSGIYNLSHSQVATPLDIAQWVAEEMGMKDARFIPQSQSRGWVGDSPYVMLDTQKLRRTGWNPAISIEIAVKRTVRYLLNQQKS